MRFLILLVASASLWAAQAPSPTTGAPPAQSVAAGNAENGKKLFTNRGCFHCHNTEAQGGSDGPRLAPRPISLPAFTKLVRQPLDQMPPYTAKVLSEQEIADIYSFLLTIPPPPAVSTIPLLNR
jgi:ubiquinol-cytochrome c reductase cytochrome c subunit